MVRGLLLWVLLLPIVLLLGHYRGDDGSQRSALDLQAMTDPAEIAAFFVLLVLVTPLFEEFVFRGLIHRAFRLAMPAERAPVAIVCGGAVFTLVHEPAVWPEVLALGVLLGYLYDRTRTIWVPVAVHVVHNLTAFLFIRWS